MGYCLVTVGGTESYPNCQSGAEVGGCENLAHEAWLQHRRKDEREACSLASSVIVELEEGRKSIGLPAPDCDWLCYFYRILSNII